MPTTTTTTTPAHLAAAEQAGIDAADQLARDGHVTVVLEPGDGTRYMIAIMSTGDQARSIGGPYLVGLVGGHTYPWQGCEMHPGYVGEKWCSDHAWTARVLAAFLTGCADMLAEAAKADQVPATAARPGDYYVPVCVTVDQDGTVTAQVDAEGAPWMYADANTGTRWDGNDWGDATEAELIEIDAKLAAILTA